VGRHGDEGLRVWFNRHRPHSMLGGRTPEEAWSGVERHGDPQWVLARGEAEPAIRIERGHVRDDPRLPVIDIRVTLRRAA